MFYKNLDLKDFSTTSCLFLSSSFKNKFSYSNRDCFALCDMPLSWSLIFSFNLSTSLFNLEISFIKLALIATLVRLTCQTCLWFVRSCQLRLVLNFDVFNCSEIWALILYRLFFCWHSMVESACTMVEFLVIWNLILVKLAYFLIC